MDTFPAHLTEKLNTGKPAQPLPPTDGLIDFSSNDYLGFAASKEIFEATQLILEQNKLAKNGATGSRACTGNHTLYEQAEKSVASFHQAESALIFNSGYHANVGFFSCVPQKGDVVLYDDFIHAGIRDGLKLCGAQSYKFAHNDKEALYKLIERYRSKAVELYVVTEAVFSIDGDTPNLEAFVDMCNRYKCRLVVDEAYSIGVFGDRGQGLLQAYNLHNSVFARLVSFGKAMGCCGAAVLGSAQLTQYLSQFSRGYMHATALPPHSVATIISAYSQLKENPLTVSRLHTAISHFKTETERCHLPFILSYSTIHSIVVPGADKAKNIAAQLQRAGFATRTLTAPEVPAGQERIRFCIHNFNSRPDMSRMLDVLTQALRYL